MKTRIFTCLIIPLFFFTGIQVVLPQTPEEQYQKALIKEEGEGNLPNAIERAHLTLDLDEKTWQNKYDIIVKLYGFAPDSWEANVTPKREAFCCFRNAREYQTWLESEGKE